MDASSLVCGREPATIEPVVSGQQLIAWDFAGPGKVIRRDASVAEWSFDFATRGRFADLRTALQQA
ncbi:MAG TPA: hypothetical protein VJT71_18320 [Pyrinomonadaceae bacterium]|nr:hypothetical protein [Pyrinomonadaceae bacterium]